MKNAFLCNYFFTYRSQIFDEEENESISISYDAHTYFIVTCIDKTFVVSE